MARVFNFSAGPAVLPEPVLKKAAAEMLDCNGSGMSVMEMSHRSKDFEAIIGGAESGLRKLMNIPEKYKVLFLQGGASSQFAMVPLNLLGAGGKADFINTGTWSKKAISETKHYGKANVVATSEDKNFSYIPKVAREKFDPSASYVHITSNNTIEGTKYAAFPDTGTVPLVADMSSNILSETMDVTKFGLIYAGAQKNIGPAGVTVVIIREDLIGKALPITPIMFNYETHAKEKSLYNTPPTYGIYIAKLVFDWMLDMGGVPAMEKVNRDKAKILYDFIDNSNIFKGTAVKEDRSIMNVPFTLPSDELTDKCLKEAKQNGLVQLKGHRSVGGMRASIYNAMPVDGVKKLVDFLKNFEMGNK
jgi:phosphoserine aminotransferase